MIRRWMTASLERALADALLLTGALMLFIAGTVVLNGLDARMIPNSLLLIVVVTALVAALRMRPRDGAWWRQALDELGYGALLTVGFALLTVALLGLMNLTPPISNGLLVSVLCWPLYLGFRAATRLLLWWDMLRRRYLIWSLTHAHLVVVGSVALVMTVIILTFSYASNPATFTPPEGAGLLGRLLDLVIFSLFPALSVFVVLIVAALLVILPPSGLFSYFVARRMTVRLKSLADAAARFRAGDYTARSPVLGEDEVAQLQADFNAMADALDRAIAELRTERDTVAGLLDARRELVANVSHDLRTPAATIRSTLESSLARWDGGPPPELRQDMGVMLSEIERLQKLIDDLFLLSRAEVGQLTLRLEPVDAAAIIRQVVGADARPAWDSARVEVTADLPPGLPPVRADADRLAQALHNLVYNAVRHTPPGGIVVVGAAAEPGHVTLTVRDSGEGIPAESLPHVWERFYQVEPSAGGAGLGLSIVRELAELMEGTVAVESTPGEGSCFAIRLPRA